MSPEAHAKLMSGIWGFLLGAGLAMIVGFQWAGWSTAGTTQKLSDEAVLSSRAAICVAQFMRAPDHKTKLKEFQGTDAYQKSEFIEKGGWDRMPGQEAASWGVASACVAGIDALGRTGA